MTFLRENASPGAVVFGANIPQIHWYSNLSVMNIPESQDLPDALRVGGDHKLHYGRGPFGLAAAGDGEVKRSLAGESEVLAIRITALELGPDPKKHRLPYGRGSVTLFPSRERKRPVLGTKGRALRCWLPEAPAPRVTGI